jgi:plastocyanin
VRARTRDRVLLPILMPVGILAVLALVLFAFSRILLSLPASAATATAVVVATSILVVCGIAANRSVVRSAVLASIVGAVAGVAMFAGGVALIATAGTEEGGEHEGGPPPGGVTVVAQNLAFDTDEIHLVAGGPSTITFDNQDAGQQHNIAIYPSEDELTDPLFKGDIVTGPDSTTYQIPPLEPGKYFFHCDVHPEMSGTVVVEEAPAGGGGGPGGTTVTAQNLAFDTDSIELPPRHPSTITLNNQDAGQQHNLAIYASPDDLSEPLFRGDIVNGPGSAKYNIPALDLGEYYFQCDVHPDMNGTVTVG